MNYIEPIKKELNQEMHKICRLFCIIGTPSETPRYFNFKEFDFDSKKLIIGSTQKNDLFFVIETPENYYVWDVEKFWNQFKEYRTEFLTKNYPTIKTF